MAPSYIEQAQTVFMTLTKINYLLYIATNTLASKFGWPTISERRIGQGIASSKQCRIVYTEAWWHCGENNDKACRLSMNGMFT